MKTSVSQRVHHDKYGLGVVSTTDSEYTVIEFDEHGRRTFSTRLVALQATSEPAPTKAPRKRATKAKAKEAKP